MLLAWSRYRFTSYLDLTQATRQRSISKRPFNLLTARPANASTWQRTINGNRLQSTHLRVKATADMPSHCNPVSGRPLAIMVLGRSPRPKEPQESACFWLRCAFRRGSPLRCASRMLQLWRQLMSWNRAREDAYVYTVRCASQIALRSYQLRLGTVTQPATPNQQLSTSNTHATSPRRKVGKLTTKATGNFLNCISGLRLDLETDKMNPRFDSILPGQCA